MKAQKKKCPGSGTYQMLAWDPSETQDYKGDPGTYPGAAVCIHCSGGILVVKGTVHKATSQAGYEGLAGRLRVHRPVD